MLASRLRHTWLPFALLTLVSACHDVQDQASNLTGGDVERGNASIRKYGCGSCHTIPGVGGAHAGFKLRRGSRLSFEREKAIGKRLGLALSLGSEQLVH